MKGHCTKPMNTNFGKINLQTHDHVTFFLTQKLRHLLSLNNFSDFIAFRTKSHPLLWHVRLVVADSYFYLYLSCISRILNLWR